jgi:hypothetical protein
MRVDTGRWGEVTIKKQGERKNKFDQTKSFSIINSKFEYSIEELKEIYEITTYITEKYTFKDLKNKLINL